MTPLARGLSYPKATAFSIFHLGTRGQFQPSLPVSRREYLCPTWVLFPGKPLFPSLIRRANGSSGVNKTKGVNNEYQ